MKGVNGTTIPILGRTVRRCQIVGLLFDVNFVAMDDVCEPVLGLDWLESGQFARSLGSGLQGARAYQVLSDASQLLQRKAINPTSRQPYRPGSAQPKTLRPHVVGAAGQASAGE